jgi:hypothetical protein
MTTKRLALLLAAMALVAAGLSYFSGGDDRGLLGRFGIGPPPK